MQRLKKFHELKADMFLFKVGLDFKLKRKKIYVMYQNLKTPAVECLDNGNYHVSINFFHQKQHFPVPANCKNQEMNRIK